MSNFQTAECCAEHGAPKPCNFCKYPLRSVEPKRPLADLIKEKRKEIEASSEALRTNWGCRVPAPTEAQHIEQLTARVAELEQELRESETSHSMFVSAGDALCDAALGKLAAVEAENAVLKSQLDAALARVSELEACITQVGMSLLRRAIELTR